MIVRGGALSMRSRRCPKACREVWKATAEMFAASTRFFARRAHGIVLRLTGRRSTQPLPPPRLPDTDDPDPIGTAVSTGLAATRRRRPPPYRVLRAARMFFARDVAPTPPDEALAQILGFIVAYPRDQQLQVLAARMLERSGLRTAAARSWIGIDERFREARPASENILARRVRKFLKRRLDRASPVTLPAPRSPSTDDVDPIASAVADGLAASAPTGLASPALHSSVGRYFSRNAPTSDPDAALAQILGCIVAHPRDGQLQVLAARMLERSSFRAATARSWSGIAERFPTSEVSSGSSLTSWAHDFIKRRLSRAFPPPLPPPSPPDPNDSDPIATAAARGSVGNRSGSPSPAVHRAANRYLARKLLEHDADVALAQVLGLIEAYPFDERLQIVAVRVLERSTLRSHALKCWQGVSDRFPGSATAFARRTALMSRERGAEAAHSWLLSLFPVLPDDTTALKRYAVGFSQINEFEVADQAHEKLLRSAPQREENYLLYAKSLERRGSHDLAARVLEQGRTNIGDRAEFVLQLAKLSNRSGAIRRAFPELTNTSTAGNREVLQLFLAQAARGRMLPPPITDRIGRVLLISGSLAAGGAERQFVATALRLQAATREGEPVAGRVISGPITVLCRSLTSRANADFFLPTVAAADIPIVEMSALPEARHHGPDSCVTPYRRFLDYLPPRISEGVRLLSDEIRDQAPDVVHIWQDGMVLSAAAAALIAGVPRIVLSVRTMPPVDRLGRKKPEYETLYRSLLEMPGVTLTANSARATSRYAEWLELSDERVRVVRNGVRALPSEANEPTLALAAAFDARCEPAGFTLGCVMRFDENKRPGPWLEVARGVLEAVPTARFILVGDGPLLRIAKERAFELGLTERTLFVGHSADVGFWLSRMTMFLLLSRIEGLPNVTIEAQLAGVPVVTTPAGGAAETVLQGVTGEVLPSAETIDPGEIAALLAGLATDPERLRAMSHEAAVWAGRTFSVHSMIEATVAAYAA